MRIDQARLILGKIKEKNQENVHRWMFEPFLASSKNMATNGRDIVVIPVAFKDLNDEGERTKSLYPYKPNMSHFVYVSELEEKLELFKWEEGKDKIECPMLSKGQELCYCNCKVCRGFSYIDIPNGVKTLSQEHVFLIGNSFFIPQRIHHIIYIANVLGVNKVEFVHQTESTKVTWIKIGESELGVMPCLSDGLSKIAEINF